MKKNGRFISAFIWILAGALMFIHWLTAMTNWLGSFGVILAILITPGVVVFPLVFWIIEGVFPIFYFILWGIGLIGFFIFGYLRPDY